MRRLAPVPLITISRARDDTRLARHSQDVVIAANALEESVLGMEAGQRGFVLTHQEQFLLPWQQARTGPPAAGADAGRPRQRRPCTARTGTRDPRGRAAAVRQATYEFIPIAYSGSAYPIRPGIKGIHLSTGYFTISFKNVSVG